VSSPTLVRRALVATAATATSNGAASPGAPSQPLDISRRHLMRMDLMKDSVETPPRIRMAPRMEADDDRA